jgi:hypothetical protein
MLPISSMAIKRGHRRRDREDGDLVSPTCLLKQSRLTNKQGKEKYKEKTNKFDERTKGEKRNIQKNKASKGNK